MANNDLCVNTSIYFVALTSTLLLSSCATSPKQDHQADTTEASSGQEIKESPQWWYAQGQMAVEALAQPQGYPKQARNVILFIGDGMSMTTVTAARILQGQQQGQSGEENQLSFEKFPQTALSKTYNTNWQTPDSAGTMTAMMTGIKTKGGIIAMDGEVNKNDCRSGIGHQRVTLLQQAEDIGMNTAIVTTARLSHATPASTYAHSVSRHWEADSDIPAAEKRHGCHDIASQLLDFDHGDGLEIAMGGGRRNFLPQTAADPEYPNKKGVRQDGRNLMQEWQKQYPQSTVMWNQQQFDEWDIEQNGHVLGLFERSHMRYEHDRPSDQAGEPSLAQMTLKSLDFLKQRNKPYFMVVEAGRIDHGHHDGNAYRALVETIALSDAVQTAVDQVDLNDTLIIVTADHSHTFNMAGYPQRGNSIIGLVRSTDAAGQMVGLLSTDSDGYPYTTLGYANGPGHVDAQDKRDLRHVGVESPDYLQAVTYPLESETHSGEDVAIYAIGAGSYLVRGTIEQNVIYHIMKKALGIN